MRQASPRHVGDVQQAVDAAQVHERAIVGQVLHRARQDGVFAQLLERLGALLALLFFQQLLARDHDVAALLVQLDDADFELVALHAIEIAHRPQINLRARQKRARAQDVDRQAALDAVDDARLDRGLVVVGLLDLVPRPQALGLVVREVDVAFFGVSLVAHHGDFLARVAR